MGKDSPFGLQAFRHQELEGKSRDELTRYYDKVVYPFVYAWFIEHRKYIRRKANEVVGRNHANFVIGYIIGTIFIYTAAYKLYFWVLKQLFSR